MTTTEPSAVAPGLTPIRALMMKIDPALPRAVLLILACPMVLAAQSVCNPFQAVVGCKAARVE